RGFRCELSILVAEPAPFGSTDLFRIELASGPAAFAFGTGEFFGYGQFVAVGRLATAQFTHVVLDVVFGEQPHLSFNGVEQPVSVDAGGPVTAGGATFVFGAAASGSIPDGTHVRV